MINLEVHEKTNHSYFYLQHNPSPPCCSNLYAQERLYPNEFVLSDVKLL